MSTRHGVRVDRNVDSWIVQGCITLLESSCSLPTTMRFTVSMLSLIELHRTFGWAVSLSSSLSTRRHSKASLSGAHIGIGFFVSSWTFDRILQISCSHQRFRSTAASASLKVGSVFSSQEACCTCNAPRSW